MTDQVEELYGWINENIWRLNKLSKEDQELQMTVGDQCNEPYECWYYGYCHPGEEQLKLPE